MRRASHFLVAVACAIAAIGSPRSLSAQIRPAPYPYPGRYLGLESDLRLAVTPKEATVYVDGYYAGHVDDYDGAFQRLHVEAGAHEIVIYLKGYKSWREKLYLSPRATRKISAKLEPLSAGAPDEPEPVPTNPPNPPRGYAPPGPNDPGV